MKSVWLRVAGAVLLAAVMALLSACGHTDDGGDDAQALMLEQVRGADHLVLARMAISKTAIIDDLDPGKAKGLRQMAAALVDALKIGNRRAAYSYDTYMRATLDLSQLTSADLTVDESSRTIRLTLPPVQTEFDGRDMAVREEHYRVTGLRSGIGAKERAELKEKMNSALMEEVKTDPAFAEALVRKAEANGRRYFQALLARDGYTVDVQFRKQ